MKKYLPLLILVLNSSFLAAQSSRPSITQEQSAFYGKFHFTRQAQWDSLDLVLHPNNNQSILPKQATGCTLNKRVFGWLPYWTSTAAENNLNVSLLSDVAYFSYDVNASTGGYSNIYSWTSDAFVTKALSSGVKVSLTATLFTNHATFFGSTASENNFITTIINLVKARGATGVNIDFEAVPSSQSANLTSFIQRLCDSVHNRIAGGQVSIAAPAVNWSGTWNVAALKTYVDLWVIMGYDYYYGGSPNAGPVSPLTGGGMWGSYDCTNSVIYYLTQGVPNSKVALGVPYYGYDWPTSSAALNAPTTGSGTATLYNTCAANAITYGRIWDNYSRTPHYTYGSYHQCWYEDNASLSYKYDMVNIQNIAGIGIWALGYDNGYSTAWTAIQNKFTSCGTVSCTGEFCDLGDTGKYYNNENWTYTLAPTASSSMTMTFSSFNTTAGDVLSIYNGNSTAAPLIGNYSGTTSPGTVNGTTGSLTFKFKSSASGATNTGWKATWACVVGPSANFIASPLSGCPGMTVNFTDQSTSPGTITGWKWTFTGGTPGTSTAKNPTIVYNTPGSYAVKEVMYSSSGNDSITKTAYINISTVNSLPLSETFQSATFPPAGWVLNLPNPNDSVWELCKSVGYSSSQCMYFPANCGSTSNITGERQQMYTPTYSFTSAVNEKMWFDVAYEPSKVPTYSDTLDIYYSLNCGSTWTKIYSKGGLTLCTTGSSTSAGTDTNGKGCFVPPNTAAWRTDTISLSALNGKPAVMFSFESRSGWGNIIYIDNINVNTTTSTSIQSLTDNNTLKVYPNPFRQSFTIDYTVDKNGPVNINLIDMLGRLTPIHSNENESAGQHSLKFDFGTTGMAKGVYVVQLQTGNSNTFLRIIAE